MDYFLFVLNENIVLHCSMFFFFSPDNCPKFSSWKKKKKKEVEVLRNNLQALFRFHILLINWLLVEKNTQKTIDI